MTSITKVFIAIFFTFSIFFFGIANVFTASESLINDVKSCGLSSKLPNEIETSLQENMFMRHNWINLHGLVQKMLGRTVVEDSVNSVFKLNSGAISTVEYHKSNKKLDKFANNMLKLKKSIPESVDFIYIQLPYKIDSNDELPAGIVSYANDSADRLISRLSENGIEVLDIRKEIHKAGFDWPSLYYKTDHHWKPQTAMWAAGIISKYLADNHNYLYDSLLYSPENMQTETVQNLFLGSAGRRTGSLYAGTDDFDIYTPAYKTLFDFTSYPEGQTIHRRGSFREAFIDENNLKKDYYNINNYAAYTGDSTKTTISTNELNPINDKNVLLIRDSYSCALQPFLSLSYKEIETLDLRYYRDESVIDHIKNNDYDIVIVAYNAQSFDSQRFSFHKIPN